ncbi:MAG: putative Ig domain-containing protein [Planctomycetota bacterium]
MTRERFSTELAKVGPWNEGAPELHAPRVFGAGAGSPFFLPVPATGERPLAFEAEGLPEGLSIDPASGIITGSVAKETEATARITAKNKHGTDEREIRIVVGGRIALTPPLGWNSWNVWARQIDEQKVIDCAEKMVSTGLAAHGFSYINIDDCWQGEREGPLGALQANDKFDDMKALGDRVHAMGLRLGIYSTPWTKSYAGFAGSSTGKPAREVKRQNKQDRGWYFGEKPCLREDARQWAKWGIDYLKYDWGPWEAPDVEAMRDALRDSGRDIVYSLSNSAPFDGAADWARLANCWRTTGDIRDTWQSVSGIGFSQDKWTPFGGPGHWNDPDMLVVGKLGWGEARENRLTPDEQITHITLWSILASPLLLGCDLAQLDEFTLNLMSNDGMLEVNQDPLGRQGHCLREVRRTDASGRVTVHECAYTRELEGGDVAVALFNRADSPAEVEVSWAELGIEGARAARDIWADRDMGKVDGKLAMGVPSHGAQFVRLGK